MPTPHNEAKKGEIAKVVLMPGDPNRAKWMAETFLHDVKLVNKVRNAFCYTGYTKNNKLISIMSSGMGNSSIGIYSYELYTEYDVDLIIRVGTCGSYQEYIDFYDILVAKTASSDSNYGRQLGKDCNYIAKATPELVDLAIEVLNKNQRKYYVGEVFASDVFYDFDKSFWKTLQAKGVLGVEMESFALYINAEYLNKKALTLVTVSDHFIKKARLTPEQRLFGLTKMIEAAIEIGEKFA